MGAPCRGLVQGFPWVSGAGGGEGGGFPARGDWGERLLSSLVAPQILLPPFPGSAGFNSNGKISKAKNGFLSWWAGGGITLKCLFACFYSFQGKQKQTFCVWLFKKGRFEVWILEWCVLSSRYFPSLLPLPLIVSPPPNRLATLYEVKKRHLCRTVFTHLQCWHPQQWLSLT